MAFLAVAVNQNLDARYQITDFTIEETFEIETLSAETFVEEMKAVGTEKFKSDCRDKPVTRRPATTGLLCVFSFW